MGIVGIAKEARIKVVGYLVELNERIVCNRKVKEFYKKEIATDLKVAIDVGVNKGQYIDLFKSVNPECSIIGFEPNPMLFDLLQKRYGKDPTIRLYQMGISNTNGFKIFRENVFHATSTFEELNYNSKYLAKKARVLGVDKRSIIKREYEVPVTTLYDFIVSNCDSDVDVLKIDTEGHEYHCLEGLFQKELPVEVKYIQIEEHDDDMYIGKRPFSEIERILKSKGYSIVAKFRHGFGDIWDVIFKLDHS